MADERRDDLADWAEGPAEKGRRGGLPGWAWFCGCGCLSVVALVAVLVVLMMRELTRAVDSERQEARLAEVLPYDELPSEVRVFGWSLGTEFLVLNDERGFMWGLYVGDSGSASRGGNALGPEALVSSPFAFYGVDDVESGEVEVQGRTLALQRFRQGGSTVMSSIGVMAEAVEGREGKPVESDGASVLIDVTPEGGDRLTLLFLVEVDAVDPVADETIRELLAPFHIGPERGPPPAPPEDDEGQ